MDVVNASFWSNHQYTDIIECFVIHYKHFSTCHLSFWINRSHTIHKGSFVTINAQCTCFCKPIHSVLFLTKNQVHVEFTDRKLCRCSEGVLADYQVGSHAFQVWEIVSYEGNVVEDLEGIFRIISNEVFSSSIEPSPEDVLVAFFCSYSYFSTILILTSTSYYAGTFWKSYDSNGVCLWLRLFNHCGITYDRSIPTFAIRIIPHHIITLLIVVIIPCKDARTARFNSQINLGEGEVTIVNVECYTFSIRTNLPVTSNDIHLAICIEVAITDVQIISFW